MNTKEDLGKQVEQERIRTRHSIRAIEEFQQLVLQKSSLEESQTSLKSELDALRRAHVAAEEDFRAKTQMGGYEANMKERLIAIHESSIRLHPSGAYRLLT